VTADKLANHIASCVSPTNFDREELEGMRAAAYIARELDKGTPVESLVKEFDGDERSVKTRIAFINYHNWVTKDIDGKWHLVNKGRFWVKRLLGALSAIIPLIFKPLEEAAFNTNPVLFV